VQLLLLKTARLQAPMTQRKTMGMGLQAQKTQRKTTMMRRLLKSPKMTRRMTKMVSSTRLRMQ